MQFENVIPKLPEPTVKKMHNIMLEACLSYESGSDWRGIFRREAGKTVGAQRKAYSFLASTDNAGMERLCRAMIVEV
jgi:hypothetical protein